MNNILFVMPDERKVYQNTNVEAGAFHLPSLAFAILGAIAKKNDCDPTILDLTLFEVPEAALEQKLSLIRPELIGITCTSATYAQAVRIAEIAKKKLPTSCIIIGGPHVSSLPEETLTSGMFDYVFIGEAERSFDLFLKKVSPQEIRGLAFFKENGEVHKLLNSEFLRDLDTYPFPDYLLYDLNSYHISKLHSKNNPVVWIETSRGCPFDCKICNKAVHGQTFRPKSVQRVIAEMNHMVAMGIKEFHIADDGFTSNIKRAEDICQEIVSRDMKFSWSCVNGIRVDRVSLKLLNLMKQAGCYRISFGIESGNQRVLDNLGKKITLDQVESAVKMAKQAGLEVFGFFIFGFEDDTAETMMDTIRFAQKLPLDLAKASLMMPFPGSPLYNKYKELDLLFPPGDYHYYNAYMSPRFVYRHPTLDWAFIEHYQSKFYRGFYFNPRYLARRVLHALRSGSLFSDLKMAFAMNWFAKHYSGVPEQRNDK